MDLSKNYDFKESETRIYKLWEESEFFNPDNLSERHKEPFTIIMPPPNANGPLHIGHALFATLQDIMIRFERMRGRKTLWLPGADHAGFETQVVFDKKLEKEGKSRFGMDRNVLWREMWNFTQANKKIMENQLRRLGASCDWSREKFTLDPDIVKVVHETFKKLYDDDLAYRDQKTTNWCVKHQTVLSDLEIKYVEREDILCHIKYGDFVVATVRPETIFGDVALAVNPKDKRYKKYIGSEITVKIPLGNNQSREFKLPIIGDEAVDPNFGTGMVKVTPAHDSVDYGIWQRHKDEIPGSYDDFLNRKTVIDERGRLKGPLVGSYEKMKVMEAREKVIKDAEELGILKKTEPYTHQIPVCYKCGTVLESLPKPQWFIAVTKKIKSAEPSLRDLAVAAVKSKKIKFVTKRFEKIFLNWMENIHDWNISRQIWWGINIPVWYCDANPEHFTITAGEIPDRCSVCGEGKLTPDTDVFDTWFSSGQWPFATLMSHGDDFKKFYPTDVMETGWDIIFFWVARMIMLGLYRTGEVPFKTVYLHGLVRDRDREKMSKSKGNVIDPLGIIDLYGADALRMALVVGNTAGNDIIISEDKIRGYRNFVTKVWNASRFILSKFDENLKNKAKLTADDKKNLKEFGAVKTKVTKYLEKFDFHHAGETIYHYFWHTFADKIIEESKARLNSENSEVRAAAQDVLLKILLGSIKLLHPFMPFVTEEIYEKLPMMEKKRFLMVEEW